MMGEDSEPRVLHEPLFMMHNHHYETCGKPPFITDEAGTAKRCAYFQNGYGEQLVFVYDIEEKQGMLYHGDTGWENPCRLIDGAAPGLVLSDVEQMWLIACWCAATGADITQTIRRASAQYAQAARDAELRVAWLKQQAAETGSDIQELLKDDENSR